MRQRAVEIEWNQKNIGVARQIFKDLHADLKEGRMSQWPTYEEIEAMIRKKEASHDSPIPC